MMVTLYCQLDDLESPRRLARCTCGVSVRDARGLAEVGRPSLNVNGVRRPAGSRDWILGKYAGEPAQWYLLVSAVNGVRSLGPPHGRRGKPSPENCSLTSIAQ